MSQSFESSPEKAVALRRDSVDRAARLSPFLAVAARTRTAEDLARGIASLNRTPLLSDAVVAAYSKPWENDASGRQIRRGAALAQLLIEEAMPGLELDAQGFIDTRLNSSTYGETALDAELALRQRRRDAATGARFGVTAEEAAQNDVRFAQAVEAVLQAAGMSEAFNIAVGNLNDDGLEVPTSLPLARYGAATVILGMAILQER